ncbi:hypothetical protein [Polaromonas sp.]|uniref:hypothetical protein n=1 Tax=Polaromonas sp. TaxID=1869339 RepID=UPI003BB67DD7
MTDKRRPRTERTERHAQQQRTGQLRRDQQKLAERYEAQPLLPEPEPQGLYRP